MNEKTCAILALICVVVTVGYLRFQDSQPNPEAPQLVKPTPPAKQPTPKPEAKPSEPEKPKLIIPETRIAGEEPVAAPVAAPEMEKAPELSGDVPPGINVVTFLKDGMQPLHEINLTEQQEADLEVENFELFLRYKNAKQQSVADREHLATIDAKQRRGEAQERVKNKLLNHLRDKRQEAQEQVPGASAKTSESPVAEVVEMDAPPKAKDADVESPQSEGLPAAP